MFSVYEVPCLQLLGLFLSVAGVFPFNFSMTSSYIFRMVSLWLSHLVQKPKTHSLFWNFSVSDTARTGRRPSVNANSSIIFFKVPVNCCRNSPLDNEKLILHVNAVDENTLCSEHLESSQTLGSQFFFFCTQEPILHLSA